LGEVFRANMGYNPPHGVESQSFHPALLWQFKGIRNEDPGEVHQQALPVCVYRELHHISKLLLAGNSHLDTAIVWLLMLAFFWCMQSCEYADVQGECGTKVLCVRNFRFFDENNKDITSELCLLFGPATVSITFKFQSATYKMA
jgi:hypothetical protein